MLNRVGSIRAVVASAGAVTVAILLGVPEGIISLGQDAHTMSVNWWDYLVWASVSALSGALVATHLGPGRATARGSARSGVLGGLLSLLAVGCLVCNRLLSPALDVSGALSWFSFAQPVMGAASVVLLANALRRRLGGLDNEKFTLAA